MATNEMRREAAKRKLANQQANRAERARKRKRTATIASVATVVVVVVAVIAVFALTGNSSTTTPDAAAPDAAPAADGPDTSGLPVAPLPTRPAALPASVNCSYPASEAAAKPVQPPADGQVPAEGKVPATLQTSAGTVGLSLDRALAPCAVNSFMSLAKQGYLNDTPCHRLTTGEGLQVLQCGDPSGVGTGGPGYKFDDEVFEGLKYGRGQLAMANSGPNTNGSQFFMIFGDAQLPPNYSLFGSIDAGGLSTLDKIAKAGDDSVNGPGDGKPNTPVTIQAATVQG